MAKTRMVVQFGMGSSIRSRNYTEAAARAIRDALWRNSLNVAEFFDLPKTAMLIDVEIGIPQPEMVNCEELVGLFPYGTPSISVVKGGLDVPKHGSDGVSVIAHAAIIVSFDLEPSHG